MGVPLLVLARYITSLYGRVTITVRGAVCVLLLLVIVESKLSSFTSQLIFLSSQSVNAFLAFFTQTAAFALPTLERLLFRPKRVPAIRVLVLTPARELAVQ